jgi:hypothetical protein
VHVTVANYLYISGQLLSYCQPLLGQVVHVNFLTPVSCRVLGRRACVVETVRYYASYKFSVQTSKENFQCTLKMTVTCRDAWFEPRTRAARTRKEMSARKYTCTSSLPVHEE